MGRASFLAGYAARWPALLTVALLTLSACGPAPVSASPSARAAATGGAATATTAAGPVSITFANWASAEAATKGGIAKIIDEFEKANPNIMVKSVPIAFSDMGKQLLLQNASGNAPDVAEIAGNDGIALAEAGALEPLDDLVSKDFQSSLTSSLVELGRYNGRFLLAPWTSAPFGFWYDRTLMQQAGLDPNSPPKTIDQLRTDLAAVKTKIPGVIPLGWDTTNRSFGLDYNWPLMRTFGAEPIANGKANANTPEMTKYLTFMREIMSNGYGLPNKLLGYFRPLAAQNKVAFTFDGPYLKGVMQKTNKMSDAQIFQTWGVTTLPTVAGKPYTSPTDHQLVIFKSSKHKAAAAKFVEWLVSSKDSIEGYTIPTESSLPPVKDAVSKFPALDTPIYRAYAEQVIPTEVRPPWGKAYSAGFGTIMAGVQRAISTTDPIPQILTDMQTELARKLAGD